MGRVCNPLLTLFPGAPLQERWGRLAIRSAYRSREVNGLGSTLQKAGKAGYNCGSNERNAAHHIWDMLDKDGHMGATACVVLPAFWDAHQGPGDWQILARWIDDNLPYSSRNHWRTPERTVDCCDSGVLPGEK